jgi:hypothetical protein
MYLPSLQDPGLPPTCQLRIRIMSGCIERDGSIYRQISDTPQHDAWKPLPFPPAPSTYGKTFSATPELQLIVEETLSSRLLHASFHVSGSSLLSWQLTHQGGQQSSLQGLQSPLVTTTTRNFGAYALVQKLRRRIKFTACLRKDVKITSSRNGDQSHRVVWDGECNRAEGFLWPKSSLENVHCPSQEEWIVVQCRPSEVEILRANFFLLYSVICLSEDATTNAADIILTYKRHCLICLGATDVLFEGKFRREISPKPLIVHSFLHNPDSRTQLFDDLEVKGSDSGFVSGSMPHTKPAYEMK